MRGVVVGVIVRVDGLVLSGGERVDGLVFSGGLDGEVERDVEGGDVVVELF